MTVVSLNSASGSPIQAIRGRDSFTNAKQAFSDLESALKSGNLSDADAAFAQLQANAPPQANQANNPIRQKVDELGKALNAGDLNAAQTAFADLKQTISQRPAAGRGSAGGGGGPPPGGKPPGGEKDGASSSSASNSSKVYDPRDTNKDDKVSAQEQLAYDLKHPTNAIQNSVTSSTIAGKTEIDAFA